MPGIRILAGFFLENDYKLSQRDRNRVALAGAVATVLTFMLLVATGGIGV